MVGPIEGIGTTAGTPGVARLPAGKTPGADFAAALRQATGAATTATTPALSSMSPVDLTATLERMQRATAHLQQARAYFQPLPSAITPQVEAEA